MSDSVPRRTKDLLHSSLHFLDHLAATQVCRWDKETLPLPVPDETHKVGRLRHGHDHERSNVRKVRSRSEVKAHQEFAVHPTFRATSCQFSFELSQPFGLDDTPLPT